MNRFFKHIFVAISSFSILFQEVEAKNIDLQPFEKKIFSQNGEDGVTLKILDYIGTTNKYYVEFGVEDGLECNTRVFRENFAWQGLMMDGCFENQAINLQKEFITSDNINQLFEKYNVPSEFDILSIDIDFNDFYVWNAISNKYKPRIVIIEYNASISPKHDWVVREDKNYFWDGTNYAGAGILSYRKLGNSKGYTLVYAEDNGVNLFFVRNDVLKHLKLRFKDQNDALKLYKVPRYFGVLGGHPRDPLNRNYISYDEAKKINQ